MIGITNLRVLTLKNTINNLVATTIIFFLSACGGSSGGGGGLVTTAPAAPAAPAAPVVTLDNMTGLNTFVGHSAIWANGDNDTTQWRNKSNQTVATIAVNNTTNEITLLINQQLTNDEMVNVNVKFTQANYTGSQGAINYLGGTFEMPLVC